MRPANGVNMPLTLDAAAVEPLLAELRVEVRKGNTLQDASQRLMDRFQLEFAESLVLARTYATIPYGILPARDRAFVQSVAQTRSMAHLLRPETRVLSLLGTAGIEPAWRDRCASRDHLGIPLLSEDAVAEIPMVAALTRQLGNSISWYEKRSPTPSAERFGVFTESFFITDPWRARDYAGRLLIPARQFVQTYNVNTVFGVGGQFLASRIILVSIFFSSESLQQTPPWLLRLPLILATATTPLVSRGKLYGPSA